MVGAVCMHLFLFFINPLFYYIHGWSLCWLALGLFNCTKVVQVYVSCIGSITLTTAIIIYVYIDLIIPSQHQFLHIIVLVRNYKWWPIVFVCFALGSWLNSLLHGKCVSDFKAVNTKHNLRLISWVLKSRLPWNKCERILVGGKPTLVQVMAWCHQTTNHYLDQCCWRSRTSCSVSRPVWVKSNWV